MMTSSKQLIEWRDRILATPKHLREFEEECGLRSIEQKIKSALYAEREQARVVRRIQLSGACFKAVVATADYHHEQPSEGRKLLLKAVGDLYFELSRI